MPRGHCRTSAPPAQPRRRQLPSYANTSSPVTSVQSQRVSLFNPASAPARLQRLTAVNPFASACRAPCASGTSSYIHLVVATSEIIASTGDHTGSLTLGDRTLDVRTANSSERKPLCPSFCASLAIATPLAYVRLCTQRDGWSGKKDAVRCKLLALYAVRNNPTRMITRLYRPCDVQVEADRCFRCVPKGCIVRNKNKTKQNKTHEF